jgi:site-specific recombinase XerD
MKRQLNQEKLRQFEDYLVCEERSNATIEKYLHDMRTFYEFVGNREVVKSIVLDYKNALISSHAVTSANSMLAAINVFFSFLRVVRFVCKTIQNTKIRFLSRREGINESGIYATCSSGKKE